MKIPGIDALGWMQPNEIYWLNEQAKFHETCIEVGSFCGKSSMALADGIKGHLYCVENFSGADCQQFSPERVKATFLENMKDFEEKYSLIEMDSLEAAQKCDSPVDMIFIDASHKYEDVKRDILAWLPHVKILICGHDYDMKEVRKAVDEIFGSSVKKAFGEIWYVEVASGIGNI